MFSLNPTVFSKVCKGDGALILSNRQACLPQPKKWSIFLDGRLTLPQACYTFKICGPVGNIDRTHQQLFGFGEWWLCAWIFSTWSVPVRAMHSSLVPLYLQRVEEHLLILWSCQSDSQNFQDNTGRSTRLCRSFIRSLQGLEAHLWLANWHPAQAKACLSSSLWLNPPTLFSHAKVCKVVLWK